MTTRERAESEASKEVPEYYSNLDPYSIGDTMRDLDNPHGSDEWNRLLLSPTSRNFMVDFSDDEAWGGFDLDAASYSALLKAKRPSKLNTRWINIWRPYGQRDILEVLAKHYDFTPRLLGLMSSPPLKNTPSNNSSTSSRTSFFHRPRHSHTNPNSTLPTSSDEGQRGPFTEKTSPDSSIHAASSQNTEDQIGMNSTSDPFQYRSVEELNPYMFADQIWHFHTVDWGRRYLSISYNTLHNTPRKKRATWEEEMNRDRPHGKRLWTWLLLCEDRTIIMIHEDPFPHRNGTLTHYQQFCNSIIRKNLVNVFRQLSKGYDHSRDPASKRLPLRTRLGEVEEETTHRPTDMPGLLFYYLFDDWENIYTYIATGKGYAEEIDHLRECMLTKAELEHVDRLHHIGRKLGVLKRLYSSYDILIEQVLKKQEATLASLKNSQAFPSGMQSMEQSGQLVDPNLIGVPLSSAARMRFETLRRRIRLYALNEVEECLLQKESLTMVNFNLIAIKESYSVERLTRITLVLAKVTMLFMPVSLMSGYFSSQLVDAKFTVKAYWTWFAVILSASIFVLTVFSILSGADEGKMDLKSWGTKVKEYSARIWARRVRKGRVVNSEEE